MNRHTATTLGCFALLSCSAILPAAMAAQQTSTDPFIWLEDIDGKRQMDWVNAKNTATVAVLGATPLYQSIYDPDKVTGNTSVAYPVLLTLLYGSTPPTNLARRLRPRSLE